MADNLQWLNFTGFPGVNTTASDHYMQPKRAEGPNLVRRLLSIDPFTEPGAFLPAKAYALEYPDDGSSGIACRVSGESTYLYRVIDGHLQVRTGDEWAEVTSDTNFHDFGGNCRFATGFNALFIADGVNRVRVVGWAYDTVAFPMLAYSSDHTVAEVKYTYGTKSTPDNASDDFLAKHLAFHNEALILARDSEVRISAAYEPLVFWDDPIEDPTIAKQWFYVIEGGGDEITGVRSFQGKMLVVAKTKSLHGFTGTDPAANYSHVVIDDSTGLIAPNSLASGNESLWGCGEEGPWMFSLETGNVAIGAAIEADWNRLSHEERKQVVGWFQAGRYHIVLPIKYTNAPGVIPDAAMMRLSYDPTTRQWAQGWGVVGPCALVQPSEESTYLLTASDGKIWRQYAGLDLEGEEIIHELVTQAIEFGSLHRDKWIRRIRIELEQGPPTVTLGYKLDSNRVWVEDVLEAARSQAVYTAASNPEAPRYHRDGEPGCIYYGQGGSFTIDLPVTWHTKTATLRLRGAGLKVLSIGIGYGLKAV